MSLRHVSFTGSDRLCSVKNLGEASPEPGLRVCLTLRCHPPKEMGDFDRPARKPYMTASPVFSLRRDNYHSFSDDS